MPVVSVHRYVVAGGIAADTGRQSVSGTLELPASGTVEIGFDLATWTGAQANTAYTIFTFTTIIGSVSTLSANATDLAALGFSSALFEQVGNTITVTFSV